MRLAAMERVDVAVIPCSKEKAWDADRVPAPAVGPQPAHLAYRSPLFAAALAWAQGAGSRVVIFSALHGLVDQDALIPGPYDVTFSRVDDPVIATAAVREQARALGLLDGVTLRCALPDDYAARLAAALAIPDAALDNLLRGVPLTDLATMTERCLGSGAGAGSERFAGPPLALG